MKYLLDNNILSEPTKKQPAASVLNHLDLEGIFACTSATVWNELWYGIHRHPDRKRQQALSDYMQCLLDDGFVVLPFCQQAAEWVAAERVRLEQSGLHPAKYDSEIAAVAVVNQLTLVTRNVQDFSHFAELRVVNWFA